MSNRGTGRCGVKGGDSASSTQTDAVLIMAKEGLSIIFGMLSLLVKLLNTFYIQCNLQVYVVGIARNIKRDGKGAEVVGGPEETAKARWCLLVHLTLTVRKLMQIAIFSDQLVV